MQNAPQNNPKTKMWLFSQHFIHKINKKTTEKSLQFERSTMFLQLSKKVVVFSTCFPNFFFLKNPMMFSAAVCVIQKWLWIRAILEMSAGPPFCCHKTHTYQKSKSKIKIMWSKKTYDLQNPVATMVATFHSAMWLHFHKRFHVSVWM